MMSLFSQFDGIFSDLDGVAYFGSQVAPHAPEFFQKVVSSGLPLAYITNNSVRTPTDVARHLQILGIQAQPEQVLTSALASVRQALRLVPPPAKVIVIGGEGIHTALADAGYEIVSTADERPQVVFQGLCEDVTWKELSEAAIAIDSGAEFFATNMDRRIPKEHGLMVGNGSLVNAVIYATGVSPHVAGKPETEIYKMAVELCSVEAPLMIGDGLATDIRGARASGITCAHVLTGTASALDVMLAYPYDRPDYLCCSLNDICEEYPEIIVQSNENSDKWLLGVQCGDAEAYIDDSKAVYLSSQHHKTNILDHHREIAQLDLDEYRALTHAIWSYSDILNEKERAAFRHQISTVFRQTQVVHM